METNIDDVLMRLNREYGVSRQYSVTLINTAEYAYYLDQHEAISMFDPEHMQEQIMAQLRVMQAAGLEPSEKNIERALEAAGFAEVNYLKGYTNESADDVWVYHGGERVRRTNRKKHPAGFADRTFLARNSYTFRVGNGPLKIQVEANEV